MDTLATDLQGNGLRTASPFRFTRLVNAGAFADIGEIDINNRGVTAFSAAASSQSSTITGIYSTRNGRSTETIADTQTLQTLFQDVTSNPNRTNVSYGFDPNVDINNRNNIAFEGSIRFTESSPNGNQVTQIERLFLKDGSQFRTVGEVQATNPEMTDPFQLRRKSINDFSLNDNNQVVYQTSQTVPQQLTQAIVFEGKELTSVASNQGGNNRLEDLKILNDGSIYYVSNQETRFGRNGEVFRVAPGSTTPTSVNSEFQNIIGFDVTESGTIFASGLNRLQGPGTFQIDTSGVTKVSSDNFQLDANNRNSIVTTKFNQGLPDQINFIRNGAQQTVLKSGDQLMGNQVQSVAEGRVNDRNQIAFKTRFADGKIGIFRADLRRSFSPQVNLATDEIAAPEEGETEVALTV